MFDNQGIKKTHGFLFVFYSLMTCFLLLNPAHADSLKLKETQTDKLIKCRTYKEDNNKKYTECDQLKTGKISFTLKISAETFENKQIVFQNITTETPFGINIGDYQFNGTLANAAIYIPKTNSLSAVWHNMHEACTYNPNTDADDCKSVKDGTVKIKVSPSGATINVKGNRAVSEERNFGNQIFVALCSATTGPSKKVAVATVTIGEAIIESNVAVNCNVKRKTRSTSDDTFNLVNVGVNAKFAPIVP